MEISTPNENGCLDIGCTEVVANLGRSSAEVNIAVGEDGRYRYSVSVMYSYGGLPHFAKWKLLEPWRPPGG